MIKSFKDMDEIVLFVADYTTAKKSIVYICRDGLLYVASDALPDPPFVVATPGDEYSTILERLKRLTSTNLD